MSQIDLLNLLKNDLQVTIPKKIDIVKEKIVYSNNPWLDIVEANFLNDDKKRVKYSKITRPDFVQAVLINDNDDILFQLRYRLGSESYVLELPGGACETNEDPHHAIRRELKEEINNLKLNNLSFLGGYYLDPMRSKFKGYFFKGSPLSSNIEKTGKIVGEIEESTFFWMNKKYIKTFMEIIPISTITGIYLSGIEL